MVTTNALTSHPALAEPGPDERMERSPTSRIDRHQPRTRRPRFGVVATTLLARRDVGMARPDAVRVAEILKATRALARFAAPGLRRIVSA